MVNLEIDASGIVAAPPAPVHEPVGCDAKLHEGVGTAAAERMPCECRCANVVKELLEVMLELGTGEIGGVTGRSMLTEKTCPSLEIGGD